MPNLMPARLAELKRVAPEIEFIPVRSAEEAAKADEDADAVIGYCTSDIVRSGKKLRWIQYGIAGVEKALVPELVDSQIVLTNLQRIHGPNVADQAMALLLALTRSVRDNARAGAAAASAAKAAAAGVDEAALQGFGLIAGPDVGQVSRGRVTRLTAARAVEVSFSGGGIAGDDVEAFVSAAIGH